MKSCSHAMGGQGHCKHSMEVESWTVHDSIRRGVQGQKEKKKFVGFVESIVEKSKWELVEIW